jgi:hypothetical protein
MLFADEEDIGPLEPAPVVPQTDIASTFRRLPVKATPPPPVFHPLAYRGVVAEWPVEWRERWGRRANALEDTGLSWRDAEAQAFVEVWGQVREHHGTEQHAAEPATATEASSNPERN